MDKEEVDYKLTINTTFILDNDVELTIKNIKVDTLNNLNKDSIVELMYLKWYMYGIYDEILINNEKYIIVGKTKKKVELVRYNNKKNIE